MNNRYFLDTNIFVYTFDSTQPEKKARATDLVSQALRDTQGVISYQVVVDANTGVIALVSPDCV